MVTGIVGACGKTKRTGPTARRSSSSAIGKKSLPSAPRPCSTTMLAVGFGPVSFSIASSDMRAPVLQPCNPVYSKLEVVVDHQGSVIAEAALEVDVLTHRL